MEFESLILPRLIKKHENMKVLILDGSRQAVPALECVKPALKDVFKAGSNSVEEFILRDMKVQPCVGCFRCWTDRPGQCVKDDDAAKIVSRIPHTDMLVLLTHNTFGGYSSLIKAAIDRHLPLLLPFFTKYQGETHNLLRYDSFPTMLAIASMESEDKQYERTFTELVRRNALSTHSLRSTAMFVYEHEGTEAIAKKLDLVLDGMGVKV